MTISHLNQFKSLPLDLEQPIDQGLVRAPTQADIDLFNTAMRPDAAQLQSHLAEQVASAMFERIGSLDKLSQQAARKMKSATSSDNPMDIAQMSRSLSQYSLQMALTTKVVNKSAQAFDKLTNLQ